MKKLFILMILFCLGCDQYNAESTQQLEGIILAEYGKTEWNIGNGHTIAILGDSRMWMYPIQNYYTNHIINFGRGGITTGGVVERAPLLVPYNPEIILISIGINNYWKDCPANIIPDLTTTIDYLKANCPSASIYITGVVPVIGDSTLHINWDTDIVSKNIEIQNLCTVKGVTYIDLSVLQNGIYLESSYTYDGVHYNILGYNILSAELKKYF